MDPQLNKQLIRRRLILENSINYENKINNVDVSSILVTDNIPSNKIKDNFLEKIKKFESFSDNPIKKTYPNIANKPRNNIEIINKFNNLNKAIVSKRIQIVNKLELDNPKGLYNNNNTNKDNLNEKIKQIETPFAPENKILKLNTSPFKEYLQTSNELTKTLKKKKCSKSDYNNWEVDKNWLYFTDYLKANIEKSLSKNKLLTRKKKLIEIIHNSTK
ncbi:hypothetical protein QTP88_006300 [Uroleucon formosanum]